jgi:DNA-binding XRE family transcriptional regulator
MRLMESVKLISDAIICQREVLGITQERLAALTGLGVTTIRKIERGSCDMRISTAAKIAKVLDISLDECME